MSRNRAWETTGAIITDLIRWPGTTSACTGSSVRGWGARLPAADGRPGVRPVPRLVEPPQRGEDLRVVSEFPPGLLRQVRRPEGRKAQAVSRHPAGSTRIGAKARPAGAAAPSR